MTLAKVAWRGSSGRARAISCRTMACATAPLRRTTPIPPLPGGVAMATIVSEVENTRAVLLPERDENGLRKRVADALGRRAGNFRDGHMDDAPLVGVERSERLVHARLL